MAMEVFFWAFFVKNIRNFLYENNDLNPSAKIGRMKNFLDTFISFSQALTAHKSKTA